MAKKESRRMARMARAQKRRVPGLNLVSLMDVFTILVFFLLVNSSNSEELEQPEFIELPESVAEQRPDETIVIVVSNESITLKGETIALMENVLAQQGNIIPEVQAALQDQLKRIIDTEAAAEELGRKITIMGDRTIPFKILKKVMTSSTAAGYYNISLAVMQKASQR